MLSRVSKWRRWEPLRFNVMQDNFNCTRGPYSDDGSGDFVFSVGLPAKSGVGGRILAINSLRHASIAVWAPGLIAHGNSKLGTTAAEMLASRMARSAFS